MTLKSGKSGLKINKDSHLIKKLSSHSSCCSVSKPQQRQPVIIYTHSPRVIQTHPSNFMELVQKLTGLSCSAAADETACKPPPLMPKEEAQENETASSVITTEQLDACNCVVSEVKSSFVALEAPMMSDYVDMFGIGTDFLMCSNKTIFNLPDPSFMF